MYKLFKKIKKENLCFFIFEIFFKKMTFNFFLDKMLLIFSR